MTPIARRALCTDITLPAAHSQIRSTVARTVLTMQSCAVIWIRRCTARTSWVSSSTSLWNAGIMLVTTSDRSVVRRLRELGSCSHVSTTDSRWRSTSALAMIRSAELGEPSPGLPLLLRLTTSEFGCVMMAVSSGIRFSVVSLAESSSRLTSGWPAKSSPSFSTTSEPIWHDSSICCDASTSGDPRAPASLGADSTSARLTSLWASVTDLGGLPH
mmetsp:Transcript_1687/g.3946  ORF Transcript_1687/g.3946 Transcript_1687/m.3946 type:complete len:215 (+) Transcript_1687:809-1453(+)